MLNDINTLNRIQSNVIEEAYKSSKGVTEVDNKDMFSSLLNTAISNIQTTNSYLSDAEDEEIKLAMGETTSTHDLAIALQKASTTLQYTVAIKNKFLEAYKELMQMQI